jgi:hypothetical protein
LPPEPKKGPPWGKILLAQGLVMVVLVVLVVVLALRPTAPAPNSRQVTNQSATSTSVAPANTTGAAATAATTATIAPTATPRNLSPGTVLCSFEAGASDWSEWPTGGSSWSLLNGKLLSNGQNSGDQLGPILYAPSRCDPPTGDYFVTAKMRVVQIGGFTSGFGLEARINTLQDGLYSYSGSLANWSDPASASILLRDGNSLPVGLISADFAIGTAIHTYKLQVQGNTVSFFIDGVPLLTIQDNNDLMAGQVGMWDGSGNQIEVSSFSVTTL